MIFTHVVACSENFAIGKDGKIPWHLSSDLKYFKRITMGHTMIMGRKTFASIGKPLPGRYSIVVSRAHYEEFNSPQSIGVPSVEAALEMAKNLATTWGEECFIVGGGEIYRQTLDIVDRIYLTEIAMTAEGDTFYPAIDLDKFAEVSREDHREGDLAYAYILFERKS
jgi:dihydrofolate reductase